MLRAETDCGSLRSLDKQIVSRFAERNPRRPPVEQGVSTLGDQRGTFMSVWISAAVKARLNTWTSSIVPRKLKLPG